MVKAVETIARSKGYTIETKSDQQLDKMLFADAVKWLGDAPLVCGLHLWEGTGWSDAQTRLAWSNPARLPRFPAYGGTCPVVLGDKVQYLKDLAEEGIPVIPTACLRAGQVTQLNIGWEPEQRDGSNNTEFIPPPSSSGKYVVKVRIYILSFTFTPGLTNSEQVDVIFIGALIVILFAGATREWHAGCAAASGTSRPRDCRPRIQSSCRN
jgi:hypothetical protein